MRGPRVSQAVRGLIPAKALSCHGTGASTPAQDQNSKGSFCSQEREREIPWSSGREEARASLLLSPAFTSEGSGTGGHG